MAVPNATLLSKYKLSSLNVSRDVALSIRLPKLSNTMNCSYPALTRPSMQSSDCPVGRLRVYRVLEEQHRFTYGQIVQVAKNDRTLSSRQYLS